MVVVNVNTIGPARVEGLPADVVVSVMVEPPARVLRIINRKYALFKLCCRSRWAM
jgi:hypothetical protein